MKIQFSLKDNHKLILLILYEAGKLSLDELERVIKALNAAESDYSEFIRIVASTEDFFKKYPFLGVSEVRKNLERDVEGLEFVGLLKTSTSPTNTYSLTNTYLLGHDTSRLHNCDVELTEEGKRVAKSIKERRRVILRPRPSLRTSIFVACAFGHDEIDRLYDEELEPACRALGYKPVRVDKTEPQQTITESILEGITESACVLADLTYARPSVYFEVGFAHGLGIPLLLTCRRDHYHGKKDDIRVHFDLEQYKISFWSRTQRGRFRWSKGMKPVERLATIVPSRKKES